MPTKDEQSVKLPRLFSGLSWALAQLLRSFDQLITVAAEPDRPAKIFLMAREVDNLHVWLWMWIEDIIREDPDGDITIFDALDLINEQPNDISRKLESTFNTMIRKLFEIQLITQQPWPEEKEKIPRMTRDLADNLDKLHGLKEVVRNELSRILRKEIEQSEFPSGFQTAQSVLCFDGGGVRSYSSLLILKALMDCVSERLAIDTQIHPDAAESDNPVDPHEVFDYIFGASSGGLIAIMLGRLKMTLKDSMDKFREHSSEIFRHPRLPHRIFGTFSAFILGSPRYSEKRIVDATQTVVEEFDPSPDSKKWRRDIYSSPGDRCRTGVFSTLDTVCNSVPCIFRTYDVPLDKSDSRSAPILEPRQQSGNSFQIWQVAQATSAAPLFFGPVSIDGLSFFGGGFGLNNPTYKAFHEVRTMNRRSPGTSTAVVSIGSGHGELSVISSWMKWKKLPVISFFIGPIRSVVHHLMDTERTHEMMVEEADVHDIPYFRFSVPDLDMPFDEWRPSTISRIVSKTEEYLNQAHVSHDLQKCAEVLVSQWRSRTRQKIAARLTSKAGDGNTLQDLVDQGADVNAKDHEGETALFKAAKGGHEAAVMLLLDAGAIAGSRWDSGRTPLAFAAQNGHEHLVQILLEYGADPGSKSNTGRTPSLLAAQNGHMDIVRMLLQNRRE
ncbi:acyl transferase/acyl hydrolase/lysophospholipase [Nemania abortiva]|nr:acyl transferase/acyl hydrolase/lysophospholipase [Nemania abortiva]